MNVQFIGWHDDDDDDATWPPQRAAFREEAISLLLDKQHKDTRDRIAFSYFIEKKSMGGEMSFRPLVRPHRSLPFVTIVVCDLSCQKCS